MGAENICAKMPETLDFMRAIIVFIQSGFTDSGEIKSDLWDHQF